MEVQSEETKYSPPRIGLEWQSAFQDTSTHTKTPPLVQQDKLHMGGRFLFRSAMLGHVCNYNTQESETSDHKFETSLEYIIVSGLKENKLN